jgi:hypothetical protein
MHHDPSLQHSEVHLDEQATETTGPAGRADGVRDNAAAWQAADAGFSVAFRREIPLGAASLYDAPDLCHILARRGSSSVIERHRRARNGAEEHGAKRLSLVFKTSAAS